MRIRGRSKSSQYVRLVLQGETTTYSYPGCRATSIVDGPAHRRTSMLHSVEGGNPRSDAVLIIAADASNQTRRATTTPRSRSRFSRVLDGEGTQRSRRCKKASARRAPYGVGCLVVWMQLPLFVNCGGSS